MQVNKRAGITRTARELELFFIIDGILGIGPDRLSIYNNPGKKVVPTLVTRMHQSGIIEDNMFSIYFQPVRHTHFGQRTRINGEIVFGGSKFT